MTNINDKNMSAMSSGVASQSKAYKDNIKKWELNRLLESSEITLKDNWKKHLYIPQSWDTHSPLSIRRQNEFIDGAALFPALKRTLDGSLGLVFRKPTKVELVPGLEYLEDDADGNGRGVEQIAQQVVRENMLQGYGCIVVDFAVNDDGVKSKAADVANNVRSTMQVYAAESIRRVYTKKIGALSVVNQVVLSEEYEDTVDQFTVETKTQFRVLKIDDDGLYVQEVYREASDVLGGGGSAAASRSSTYVLYSSHEPRNSQGKRLDYMPLYFFGAESNSPTPCGSPSYDLSRMNAKHLEYSAMRNESIRQLAPTMFVFPGENFDYDQFAEDNPQGLTMGGYNAYMPGSGGSASIIQAAANDAAVEEMRHLESLMLQAGALLVTDATSSVSTETTIIQRSTESSVLGMIVRNSERCIQDAFNAVADFEGAQEGSTVDINNEFFPRSLTAQDRAQWAQEVMMGLVTSTEYRDALVKGGHLPESALEEEIYINTDESSDAVGDVADDEDDDQE